MEFVENSVMVPSIVDVLLTKTITIVMTDMTDIIGITTGGVTKEETVNLTREVPELVQSKHNQTK